MSLTNSKCQEFQIPERLHTCGRSLVPRFEESEPLYHRVERIKSDGTVPRSAFRIHGMSVIRGGLDGEPDDALLDGETGQHKQNWGIVKFTVGQIEKLSWLDKEGNAWTLKLHHSPLDCLYPHSEIFVYKNDEMSEPSEEIIPLVRGRLADPAICTVVRRPRTS